jgi:hypothetical protein
MLSRRTFLISTAATGLAGCASVVTPVPPGGGGLPTDFIDQVIAIVRAGCGIYTGFSPTVTSIAQVVAAMFGAAALATVDAIAGAVNAVASALCAAAAPTPAAMKFNGRTVRARRVPGLAQRLAVSSPANPVVIGKITVGGIPVTVTGYK